MKTLTRSGSLVWEEIAVTVPGPGSLRSRGSPDLGPVRRRLPGERFKFGVLAAAERALAGFPAWERFVQQANHFPIVDVARGAGPQAADADHLTTEGCYEGLELAHGVAGEDEVVDQENALS